MTEQTGPAPPNSQPSSKTLIDKYGGYLRDHDFSDAEVAEFLAALFRIMQSFADVGFSLKPGDKFMPDRDVGMDDVLKYFHLEDTAHETVASPETPNGKEQS